MSTTSIGTAYVLCILFGWMGLHRYFLGRFKTGLLYSLAAGYLIGYFFFDLFQDVGPLLPGTILLLLVFGVAFDLL